MRGDVPDRVPIWFWGVQPDGPPRDPTIQPVVDAYLEFGDIIHWCGAGPGIFYSASEALTVEGETRPSELADFDEQVTVYHTPAGDLTQIVYASRSGKPSYHKKYPIESEQDIERFLSVPYVPPRPDCSGFFGVDSRLGDTGIAMFSLGADPMYSLNRLTGSEVFARWSIERRDMLSEVIDVLLRRTLDWLEWVLAQQVGPLFGYVGPELCIPPLQSPTDFEEWVVRPNRVIHDAIHEAGGTVLVHSHGLMDQVLEGFVSMGADALHPVEPPPMGDVTLADAKRRVGADLCIVGNVQEDDIWRMPQDQFREMVADTVRVGMEGGGFILSPTSTPFSWPNITDRAQDNMLALLEVGLDVGRY